MDISKFMETLKMAVYFDLTAEGMEGDLRLLKADEKDCPSLYKAMHYYQGAAAAMYTETEEMIPKASEVTTPEELVSLLMLREAVMINVEADPETAEKAQEVERMFEDLDECIETSDYPEDFGQIKKIVARMIL